ncbi:MAG: CRTAC1 family protein [Isosphaerales bacterium]
MPRRALAFLGVLLVAYAIELGCRYHSASAPRSSVASLSTTIFPPCEDLEPVPANWTHRVPVSPFQFTEIAQSAGIDFVQVSGMTEAKHFPTAYGSGVAMFDFDNDGKLDLYFATMTFLPVGKVKCGPNRLYRNLGGNRFQDATKTSGLGYAGFCHGIVVGDIDNDGDQDVFLCNYGTNVLYVNNGDGTFADISKSAGIDRPGWSAGGAFLDYDNDGDLDLYVANYGSWKLPDDDRYCQGAPGFFAKKDSPKLRVYCSPKSISPARHVLYRNNGNRTFTDVTLAAGIGRTDGRGLGVVASDLNADGRIDLYVANDLCPNFVFLNQGDGTFQDVTESSGAGYGPNGQTRAGMGVDAEDVNGDGRADLFATNFWNEANALFINLGEGLFQDRTRTSGMFHDSVLWVGWGCALADFDNDGWPDCFVANGHVDDNLEQLGLDSPYAQPALLHRNLKGAGFLLATRKAGAYFNSGHVGRGVAYGDLDDDGDIDLVVNHKDGAPAVLRNDTKTPHHWIRLRLEGTRSNRDAVGARVEVEAGGRTIFRQRKGGSSLASAHDPRLLIGLGEVDVARRVTIRWPSGQVDQHSDLATETAYLLREEAGRVERLPASGRKK